MYVLSVTVTDYVLYYSAEAAIALRQRLNETADQLDALRKEHADLEVQFDTQKRDLTIAKSDRPCPVYIYVLSLTRDPPVNLINKDQVEILASLRESVNEDKALLEAETDRLKKQIKELNEKNRMQLEQVNALLLEKVNLQSEGIGQRERMLQRERAIGLVLSPLLLCVPLKVYIQRLACILVREGCA